MKNIFLVEDCNILNSMISEALGAVGYKISTFTDGEEAFNNISQRYDIYLIDINLPKVNGLELIKQIKLLNINAKIFVMSGDVNIDTILNAYNLGADDYIKKPFDVKELIAKINRTVLKSSQIVNLGKHCSYNPLKKELIFKGEVVKTTNKVNLLLDILIKNIGNIVPNNQIESYVWGEEVGNGYVRQLVSKLRKMIPCDIIQNHAGRGYKIEKYIKS